MSVFYKSTIQIFFTAFGVVVGGSVFSGLAAIITNNPPLRTMINIANSIKIWAMAIAIGGTFTSFDIINKSLFEGEIKSIIKQIIYISVALLGANSGYITIRLINSCGEIWGK